MENVKKVFKRYELKYLIDIKQYEELMKVLEKHTISDEYGKSTVCSLYYDTPDKLLIRRSLERPQYKEKLRLRSYNVAKKDSLVFIELKKKYDGIVYKRRIGASLTSANDYLKNNIRIDLKDDEDYFQKNQIMNEIDYFKRFYGNIEPSMLLTYDRIALVDKEDSNTRITFDRNILYREYDLSLDKGIYGIRVINSNQILMELKVAGAIPLWLVKTLNELHIYKTSFSKYGTAYKMSMLNKKVQKESMMNNEVKITIA